MRYLALPALLLATLPVCAATLTLPDITTPLQQSKALPAPVLQALPTRVKITFLPAGALARWNPKTDTLEISKTHWKKSPHAQCVLPFVAHEAVHAFLVKSARQHSFAWPITLADEVPALYYQLQVEQTQPDYADVCAVWRAELPQERQAFAAKDWPQFEQAILQRYSQFPGRDLPPPPFEEPWTTQAKKGKELTFYQHTYPLRRRNVSAQKFWTKGGSWLRLSPQELTPARQDPRYLIYKQILEQLFSK